MKEPTYTFTLTESERTAMARAFGLLVTKLLNAPVFVEVPNGGTVCLVFRRTLTSGLLNHWSKEIK